MNQPDSPQLQIPETYWRGIILTLSCAVIIFTIWCLTHGITTIFMHLYYFPIVLLAYRYRWNGFGLATLLALAYVGLVLVFSIGQTGEILGALYRFFVFVGIAAVIAYLSERLAIEKRSAWESTETKEQYISLAPAIILVLDRNGAITFLNRKGGEILECIPEEVTGTSWFDQFLPEHDRERVKHLFLQLVAGQIQPDEAFENPVLTRGGTKKTIRWHNTVLHDESGAITRILGFGEDITEKKKAQDSLQKLQQFQESVIANANVWISVLAPDGSTLLVWNDAAEAISGYKKTNVVGKNTVWKQLYPDKDYRRNVTGEIQRIIGRNDFLENFETEIHCKDGTKKTIVWNTRALRDAQGMITSYIAIGRDVTAQKSAEFRVGESSRFLGTMIDTLPMPIFFKDTDGKYLGCNPPFEAYIGIKREDIMGKTAYDISPRDLADRYAAADQQLFDNPVPQQYETQVQYADGTRHNVIFYKAPFFNKDGSLGGLIGAFLDISERKRMEEALRDSEERFRGITERISDLIIVVDPEGIPTFISPSITSILGLSTVSFNGKRAGPDIIQAEDVAKIGKAMERLKNGSPEERVEFRMKKSDGSYAIFDGKGIAVLTHGRYAGIQIVARDITERKQMQEALQKSEAKYRLLAENVQDVIWTADMNLRITYISPSVTTLLGVTPKEAMAEPLSDSVTSESYQSLVKYNQQALDLVQNGGAIPNKTVMEIEFHRKDGSTVWTEMVITPVFDRNKKPIGVVGVTRDISIRKQAEAALQKNRQMLTEAMDLAQLVNWEYDVRTGLFTFDDRFYALYGTTAEREGGTQMPADVYVREFIHPEDRDVVAVETEKAMKTTDPHYASHVEHRIIRRDGEIRYIIVRIGITKDAEGRTIKTHGGNQDITERKQVEEALKESEEKFRDIFNNANDGIEIVELLDNGKPGRFTDVNDVACRMLGYTREEMLRVSPLDIDTDYFSRPFDEIMQELHTAGHATFETEHRRKDGIIVPVEVNSHKITLMGKTVFLSITRDITERKEMEEALRWSRQIFSDIINFLPDPTFAIDAEGRVIAWNRAIEDLLGVPAGEIIGKGNYEASFRMFGKRRPSLINLVIHCDDTLIRKHYPTLHRDGQMLSAELDIDMLRGKRRVLWIIATPLYDAVGNVTGAIESMRDITRLKETEEELNQINQNLDTLVKERTKKLEDEVAQRRKAEEDVKRLLLYTRSVIEANPDLIVVLDEKGTILDVNTAGESLTGIPKEKLIGTPYFGYMVNDGTLYTAFSGLLDEGKIENVVQIRRTDGHVTPLSVHATVIRGRDGQKDQIIVAAHDITRQKQDEKAIQASLDEKVVLLREVHHRVKNNLQIIISLVNLQMRQTDTPEVKRIMSETQNRVRAMSLVHEKLYRSESLSRIDFADYIRFLATQLFSFYGTDTRRVRLELTMDPIMVDINTAVPLGLLMNELISNALKHAFPDGKEGTIRISGGEEGDLITLVVQDNGIGIPAELDWKNTTSLGMRLVTSLIDQVDGTIELVEGEGTTFIIKTRCKID